MKLISDELKLLKRFKKELAKNNKNDKIKKIHSSYYYFSNYI
jgi:hypothetical protein